jgi:hypothetical protein
MIWRNIDWQYKKESQEEHVREITPATKQGTA